jgi:hypothetical protein
VHAVFLMAVLRVADYLQIQASRAPVLLSKLRVLVFSLHSFWERRSRSRLATMGYRSALISPLALRQIPLLLTTSKCLSELTSEFACEKALLIS